MKGCKACLTQAGMLKPEFIQVHICGLQAYIVPIQFFKDGSIMYRNDFWYPETINGMTEIGYFYHEGKKMRFKGEFEPKEDFKIDEKIEVDNLWKNVEWWIGDEKIDIVPIKFENNGRESESGK